MPRRWAYRSLLLFGIVALAVGPAATAQPPGGPADDLTYRTPDGKVVDVKSETKESAAGIQLLAAGKAKGVTVSPADVVRFDPAALDKVSAADLTAVRATERNQDAAKGQAAYADLLKKTGPGAPERTARHLAFREAMLGAKVADAKAGDDFPPDAARAADKLAAVARQAKKGWEVWPASQAAARLYGEVDQFDKAAAVYGELAAVPDLPRDLRFEARLDEAAALARAGNALSADGTLDQLGRDKDFPASGPLRDRLAVLQVVAKLPLTPSGGGTAKPPEAAKLEDAINAAKDPTARAVGYNFLGDLYAANGLTRDAMWSYLWTDAVYNQDKDEQLVAVHRLIALLEKAGDKERADQFRDRLPRLR